MGCISSSEKKPASSEGGASIEYKVVMLGNGTCFFSSASLLKLSNVHTIAECNVSLRYGG